MKEASERRGEFYSLDEREEVVDTTKMLKVVKKTHC